MGVEQEDIRSLSAIGRALVEVLMAGLPPRLANWETVLQDAPHIHETIRDELANEPDARSAGRIGEIMAQHGVMPRFVLLASDGISTMIHNLIQDGVLHQSAERPVRLLRDPALKSFSPHAVPFREAALEIAHTAGVDLPQNTDHGFKHIDEVPLPVSSCLLAWFFDIAPFRPRIFCDFRTERLGADLVLWPCEAISDYLERWEVAGGGPP